MKAAGALLSFCILVSCSFDPGVSKRPVRLPSVPGSWLAVLGEPAWLLRWYGPDGSERSAFVRGAGSPVLELPDAVSSPVLAYPCWPDSGVEAGLARPAGAIVPFDQRDGMIVLTWKGGVSALFYRELLHAGGPSDRLPERFDWPRFSALLDSESIQPSAREDPWRVDWRTVAIRTRVSGFDSRRIVPRVVVPIRLAAPFPGPWVRTSPFLSEPVESNSGFLDAEAAEAPDAFLSSEGVLKFVQDASAWFPLQARF